MASSSTVDTSSRKMELLEKTFRKAMEVSTSSFNDSDLDACFDDVKEQYGSNLGKLLKTLVSRNDSAITNTFQDICVRRDVEEALRALDVPAPPTSKKGAKPSSSPPSSSSPPTSAASSTNDDTNPLNAAIIEFKRLEIVKLKDAIRQAEKEVKNLADVALKIREKLNNEMMAVQEERQKLPPPAPGGDVMHS